MLGLPFAFAAHFAPDYLYTAAQMSATSFDQVRRCANRTLWSGYLLSRQRPESAANRLFTTPQQRFLH